METRKTRTTRSHSQVLQNVIDRVDKAYKNFFRRVKAGEKPGFPRFKGFNHYRSFTFPQSGFKLGKKLNLSKIGDIWIVLHRPIEVVIKTLTIKKDSEGKWFAYFSCDFVPLNKLTETGKNVGIDLGITCFMMVSDGTQVENPRFFRKSEKKLKKAQRKFETVKDLHKTVVRRKAKKVVTRVHAKIRNQRQDFAFKTVNKLVKDYDVICYEDLNVKGMLEEG